MEKEDVIRVIGEVMAERPVPDIRRLDEAPINEAYTDGWRDACRKIAYMVERGGRHESSKGIP